MSSADWFWTGFCSGSLITMAWGWALWVRPLQRHANELKTDIELRMAALENAQDALWANSDQEI